ncbi:hypothetical protein RYZ26_01475 [Terasakiella sp. A23]|uniref:hypothetical protein n=1 Tax=Terasakiella sp. FCG-A23 TaxID=3080561 RepID=UPI0029536EC1|nr:hypothetical protein [Terasakiella sp. A23]MDV7338246.1 hypothetical protein [Terasakiella sp. A23]
MHDNLYDLSKNDERKMIAVLMVITFMMLSYLGVKVYERQFVEDEVNPPATSVESNLNAIAEGWKKR